MDDDDGWLGTWTEKTWSKGGLFQHAPPPVVLLGSAKSWCFFSFKNAFFEELWQEWCQPNTRKKVEPLKMHTPPAQRIGQNWHQQTRVDPPSGWVGGPKNWWTLEKYFPVLFEFMFPEFHAGTKVFFLIIKQLVCLDWFSCLDLSWLTVDLSWQLQAGPAIPICVTLCTVDVFAFFQWFALLRHTPPPRLRVSSWHTPSMPSINCRWLAYGSSRCTVLGAGLSIVLILYSTLHPPNVKAKKMMICIFFLNVLLYIADHILLYC